MKILICGSRSYEDYTHFCSQMTPYTGLAHTIIHGGARGADSLADRWGKYYKMHIEVFKPNWDKYGKRAGFMRNQEMIDTKPDLVIAFWDGVSKGTRDTISRAKIRKIDTLIIYV